MFSDLEYARLSYAGDLVVSVTFGMYVILAVVCIHFLLQRRSTAVPHRVILWYTVTMLLTGTIWFVCGAWYSELELVELPSDIGQFSSTNVLYTRLGLIQKIFYTVNIFLADSLWCAYRLFIVWGRSIPIVVVPAIVWFGVVATGFATMVLTSRPQANFQASYVINIEIAFFCLSVSLNILCTVLIAGRLVLHQRDVKQLGFTSSRTYTSILIVIAESAALYSIFGIICIPLEVLQTPVQFPFNSLIGTLTLIAPTLIVLRMALESTAHATTARSVMTLQWRGVGESVAASPSLVARTSSPPLTDSNAYNPHASTSVIDIGEGYSSERLVQDGEKVEV